MRQVTLRPGELAALARDVLASEGTLRLVARGTSMLPAIRDGDVLDIVPAAQESLAVGDVVLYLTPDDRTVIHRIVAIDQHAGERCFTLRGDALPRADEPVEARHILGKVSRVQARRASIAERPVAVLTHWAIAALQQLQGVRLYRALLRSAVRGRIVCRPFGQADRTAAVHFFGTARFFDASSPTGPETHALGAFLGQQPAGAVLLVNYGSDAGLYAGWWLFSMLVRLRYRGASVGERLIEYACERAQEHGADRLQLFVHADNRRAIRLYAKHGFAPDASHAWDARLEAEAQLSGERRIMMVKTLLTRK